MNELKRFLLSALLIFVGLMLSHIFEASYPSIEKIILVLTGAITYMVVWCKDD